MICNVNKVKLHSLFREYLEPIWISIHIIPVLYMFC